MRHALVIILTVVGAASASAEQVRPFLPARVGRVSFVSGNLAFHTKGQTEWLGAGFNYPVATGQSYWTDAEARAEMRIGPNTIAMSSSTELDIAELDEQVTRIFVPQGRIYLHLRQLDDGKNVEVDIPRGVVWLQQPGYYDIDAGASDQPAHVAVFEGSARFVAGAGVDVPAGGGSRYSAA